MDYNSAAGTLRFGAGETRRDVTVLLINDAYVEDAETFTVTLSNAQGAALGTPSTATVTITSDDTDSLAANPLDENDFFVRQQYLDFLDREPETEGFNYWTSILRGCGTDARCLNRVRVEISSRFFIELEFQRTGYYVMRLWRASFGRFPNYREFTADRRQVQNTDESRRAFAQQFVTRSEFQQLYGGLTDEQYVNQLYDTADLRPFATERAAAIEALRTGRLTRADVLREAVELPPFRERGPIYNAAFVRMQYYGYLRRDAEPVGEAYWLNVINVLSPNNYQSMICGFLNSVENQLRFAARRGRFTEIDCSQ